MNVRDIFAGGLCAAFGLYFSGTALTSLEIGSATRMGPGYFPLAVGALLTLFGVGIALVALVRQQTPVIRPSWRAVVLISLVPIVWGLAIRPLGFGPATALAAFVAAYSSRRMPLVNAALTTLGLTVVCVLVFVVGLGQPLPLLGTWFGG